jgi:hypothetical protein
MPCFEDSAELEQAFFEDLTDHQERCSSLLFVFVMIMMVVVM